MTMARIHLTGASCTGVSTLGRGLAAALGVALVDVDDHYWLPTDPPFTTKRAPAERLASVRAALPPEGWIMAGSFLGWGEALIEEVSLVVFLTAPEEVRMARLARREAERYGARIAPGGDMHAAHLAFAEWARGYDRPGFEGRSRARHEAWLAGLSLPVLRLDGAEATERLVAQVEAALRR
ncbi:MAG: adenylate kinase [Cereibacter sp.]|jgi:adenylate kinase family enzyme|nr:adenylate kinase [Cereibacter sp.]